MDWLDSVRNWFVLRFQQPILFAMYPGRTYLLSPPHTSAYVRQSLKAASSQAPAQPSGPTQTSSAGNPGSTSTASGLNKLAKAAGKLYFGTATDTNTFNDATYMSILGDINEFGILTPGNSMKWVGTTSAVVHDQYPFRQPRV